MLSSRSHAELCQRALLMLLLWEMRRLLRTTGSCVCWQCIRLEKSTSNGKRKGCFLIFAFRVKILTPNQPLEWWPPAPHGYLWARATTGTRLLTNKTQRMALGHVKMLPSDFCHGLVFNCANCSLTTAINLSPHILCRDICLLQILSEEPLLIRLSHLKQYATHNIARPWSHDSKASTNCLTCHVPFSRSRHLRHVPRAINHSAKRSDLTNKWSGRLIDHSPSFQWELKVNFACLLTFFENWSSTLICRISSELLITSRWWMW